mmetsp:Transcript_28375/g.45976  ORF Transcript_28375/g.45976 Transcript_28375/m.45976 type:complete len:203 (-) Transcript_28375:140-748(-)
MIGRASSTHSGQVRAAAISRLSRAFSRSKRFICLLCSEIILHRRSFAICSRYQFRTAAGERRSCRPIDRTRVYPSGYTSRRRRSWRVPMERGEEGDSLSVLTAKIGTYSLEPATPIHSGELLLDLMATLQGDGGEYEHTGQASHTSGTIRSLDRFDAMFRDDAVIFMQKKPTPSACTSNPHSRPKRSLTNRWEKIRTKHDVF